MLLKYKKERSTSEETKGGTDAGKGIGSPKFPIEKFIRDNM